MMWGGFGEIVDFVPINSPQILWPTIVQQHPILTLKSNQNSFLAFASPAEQQQSNRGVTFWAHRENMGRFAMPYRL